MTQTLVTVPGSVDPTAERAVATSPDTLRFRRDGIGTYRQGILPLGSDIEPVVDLISESLGTRPHRSRGQYEWGQPRRAVRLFSVDHRLSGFEVDLTQQSFTGPVIVGEELIDGPFRLDGSTYANNFLIAVGYDRHGQLVRCSPGTTCVHQPLALRPATTPEDQSRYLEPYGLGRVERISVGWRDTLELEPTAYVTSIDGSPLGVRRFPSSISETFLEISGDAATRIPVLDPNLDGGWLRVVLPGHPLVPAGYIDASRVSVTLVGSSKGR